MTVSLNLKADLRRNLGSADSRRVRKDNKIPAVIHDSRGKNINITINSYEFDKEYFKGNILSTLVKIELDGKYIDVITNKIDLNPVTDKPIHVDFVRFNKGEKVKAKAKIVFSNREKCPGLKKGGFLHIVLRRIELLCLPDSIPETINIDVGEMKVGDKVRSKNVNLPDGVELYNKENLLIASIIGRASKPEETATPVSEPGAADQKDDKTAASAAGGKKEEAKTESKK